MLRTPLHPLKKSKSGLQPNMTIQRHFSNSVSYFEYLLFFFQFETKNSWRGLKMGFEALIQQ